MLREIVSLIALAALLLNTIGLTGCTKTVTVPIEEVRASSPARIAKLTQKGGNPIEFDSAGATYIRQAAMFIGSDVHDTQRRIRLKDVDSVFYRFSHDSRQFAHKAKTFKKLRDNDTRGIVGEEIRGLFASNIRYDFDKHRGRYDPFNYVITGANKSGDSLCFRINEIESIRVKRPDNVKTALLVSGICAVAFVAIVAATWDMSIDLDPLGNWPMGY